MAVIIMVSTKQDILCVKLHHIQVVNSVIVSTDTYERIN